MSFRMLSSPSTDCLTYIFSAEGSDQAAIVDPQSDDVAVLLALLAEAKLRPKWVLRTHAHDETHPGELEALRAFGCPVVAPGSVDSVPRVVLGHEFIELLKTPGHTSQCQSFLWHDRVFCGGLFSTTGCRYQRYPQSPADLWDSVTRKIFTLPSETLVFSGYCEPGRMVNTVYEHRNHHVWFSGRSRDEFLTQFEGALAST